MGDAAARGLKSRKSRTIGAVVPPLGVAIFADGITGATPSRLSSSRVLVTIVSRASSKAFFSIPTHLQGAGAGRQIRSEGA